MEIYKYKMYLMQHIDVEELTTIAAETRLEVLRRAAMTKTMKKCIVMEIERGKRFLVRDF